jgi:diguanylate cyclase (GGDEF)-like protein
VKGTPAATGRCNGSPRLLERTLRRGDLACRYGGEESCVLLSRADAGAASAFDRRLRAALAAGVQAATLPLSFSAGAAPVRNGEQAVDAIVARADSALYRAKNAGRGPLDVAD